MERDKRYTASVVGGGSGGRLSLNALTASGRYDLVAAADISATAREALCELYPGLEVYDSHEKMFAERPTDIVCVSTWPPSHRQVVMDALQLDLVGLLCEKPLGDTAGAGADILSAIEGRGLPVVVPHGLLKLRHSEEILARVHGDEIGALELVEIECNKWDIINAGIHWLDYFVNLVPDDPPAWVMSLSEASTMTYRDGMQVETTAITYVQTVGGVRAVMETGDDVRIRRPDKGMLFRLIGTEGMIEFWAWESAYRLTNRAHPGGCHLQVERYAQGPHQRYLEDLAEQMDSARTDYALPRRSLTALELCEGAYLSSAHRAKVTLPLAEYVVPIALDWNPGRPYDGRGGRDGRKL